ncbi:Glucose/arabinose dehydrogenase, beta-propeller fold [Cnuella takakiae]|uniref:Glucose/arabinose dehydrogenase, beta-propeller fold n=1 Tax=Cnuella takakiae TaxID=1302690 RepID=A0A1M4WXT9_9BACT|nr:sorbosone dehydrogenase family protein [Cnuella takakiae]OLY91590.1 L-sorbosone dehydrogenase [Cnuella takakiae]SHE85977.1 Glucose/arabinose dehydrogenase, beta-propeller fold [Cnuella takakiae]
MHAFTLTAGFTILLLCSCGNDSQQQKAEHAGDTASAKTAVQQVNLPAPFATESSTKFSNVIGWPEGRTPQAPAGFTVSKFADSLNNPRWMYATPNGDILVAEANTEPNIKDKAKAVVSGKAKSQNLGNSANRITLFRDADGDGRYELRTTFLEGLNQPLGMLVLNNQFYVANTDGILQFPYTAGQTSIKAAGKKILELPAGGYNNHWTRNLLAAKDGSKIYVAVGSGSNVGENGMEHEVRRAAILEINPDGSGEKIYGAGLRNPVGMDWAPGTSTLWTAVNERDGLGDDLVPDYLTSVRAGGFYGWPYAYFGQNEDPRMKDQQKPELVKQTIVPDVPLGAHTASLGLAFDQKGSLPGKYKGGAFIGQHGSWNRSQFSGYKVVFVPFAGGKPSGNPEDFLSGFVTGEDEKVYGRPVGIAFTQQGNMLVADDAANTIWLVKPQGK